MKTYTMTWKMFNRWCVDSNESLCRERLYPNHGIDNVLGYLDTPLAKFLWIINPASFTFGSCYHSFRLTCCGRLVARSATYLGV